MAVNPRDIDLNREEVAAWIKEFHESSEKDLRKFLEGKLTENELDVEVDTTGHDSLADKTALIDLIMADLPSYG